MCYVLHVLSAMHPAPFPSTSKTTDDADEELTSNVFGMHMEAT